MLNFSPALRRYRIKGSTVSNPESVCCVCQIEGPPSMKLKMDCGHEAHRSCLEKWAEENPSCPMCREDLEWVSGPDELGEAEMKLLCVGDQIIRLCPDHEEHVTVWSFDPVTGEAESGVGLDVTGLYGYLVDELGRNGKRLNLIVERVGADLSRHYIDNQVLFRPMSCRSETELKRCLRTLRGLTGLNEI